MPAPHPSDVVITGTAALVCAPRAAIAPARWAASPARLQRMDRLCGLALVACDGALLDSGLQPGDAGAAGAASWNGERTAVVLGTAYGCHATNEDYYRGVLAAGPSGASPRLFAYTLPSSPVGEISIHYGIRGPATAVAPGLTASIDAIIAGLRELSRGRADRVLIAAAEVATPLLATLTPGGASLPLADSAAALVVERAADAQARGAVSRGHPLQAVSCYAAGARSSAVAEAVRAALARANLGPGAITRVLGSPADVEAIRPLGVDAPASFEAAETLGAAPLVTLARGLGADGPGSARQGSGGGLSNGSKSLAGVLLVVAGDPEGAGAAALVQA
jgi:3-oxoacyl-(acyl-carrier-protein) synthase